MTDVHTILVILVIIGLIMGLLTLLNTIALVFAVAAVSLLLVRMASQFAVFSEVKQSMVELTKVIEQQSRLLEFLGRRTGSGG